MARQRAGDRGDLTGGDRHVQVARLTSVQPGEGMARRAPEPDHHAAMLQTAIGVDEARPDGGNSRPHGLCREDVDAARLACLNVVVEEDQHLARGHLGGRIVERRPIERSIVRQHRHVVPPGQPFHQCQRLGLHRVVVDQHEVEPSLSVRGVDRLDARTQEPGLIAKGDDDGRGRRSPAGRRRIR